ncbi:hypothetical protein [Moorena sp. SIO4G3]|uniref:ammonium transporter n=1 Tax=Moorena sp. SIO4G3 TaxID=2607821 RepID=UPI00142966A2|nr:hypothetical protein [Moorena sp. SIO4G3]NEO81786.1 hypothetical protein [Moorena sp. SIO4G3]
MSVNQMIINGVLGGLVSITASSAYVKLSAAAFIGMVAGWLVVFLVGYFNKLKIDDPVGAISVHLGCGIWGTLAVVLSNQNKLPCDQINAPLCNTNGLALIERSQQLGIQVFGLFVVLLFTLAFSWVTWSRLKTLIGIRVSDEDELKGLDLQLHDVETYHGFRKEEV